MSYSRPKSFVPGGGRCQKKLSMGWIIPLLHMPTLCSLLLYLTCQVEVFNFERKEEEKEEEILREGRSETSSHVLTYTSPPLAADTSLSVPRFLLPLPGSSSLYLSVCVWLFLCPSSPPPPPPPPLPRCICFTVLYLSSLCKILLSLFSSFASLPPPYTLCFHLSSSCGGVK